jgi:glycine/D-amino acid oxidase-like deaminating enzyme
MTRRFDVIVVGGGLVGSAIGFGLCRKGIAVAVLDEGDRAHRAARANFGLLWVQSKGERFRPYAALSRQSSRMWPEFARELRDVASIDVGLRSNGGLTFCLSDDEMRQRAAFMRHQFEADLPCPDAYEMLDRRQLLEAVPHVGPDVVGASLCRLDGDVNPLRLLRALLTGLQRLGGTYLPGQAVVRAEPSTEGFTLATAQERFFCTRLVLAAGLANARLGAQVDLDIPVSPLRGQILVTEKQAPWLHVPTHIVRQTDEGGVIIGDSKEDVGFDEGTRLGVMGDIAARAVNTFPHLAQALAIRAWGGLRIMTPDGAPAYWQSPTRPDAFAFNVHSGVTLAPVHAALASACVEQGRMIEQFLPFDGGRFALQKTGQRAA